MMSYELDPYLVAEKGMSLHERLANARRITITQAEELNHKVAQMAAKSSLNSTKEKITKHNKKTEEKSTEKPEEVALEQKTETEQELLVQIRDLLKEQNHEKK